MKKKKNIKIFLPSEKVNRKLPNNIKNGDKVLFERELEKEFPEVCLYYLENVSFCGSGLLLKKGRIYFKFFYPYNFFSLKELVLRTIVSFLSIFLKFFPEKYSNGLYVIDNFSGSFFHWFGDVLQRMESLSLKRIFSDGTRYFVFLPDTPFFRKMSCLLRVYPVDIVFVKVFERVLCRNLIVVPPVAPTGNYRPEIIQSLKRRILSFFKFTNEKGRRKIYISRRKALKRKILNEEDLYPLLEKMGFEIVYMEDLSLDEQIKMATESEIMIGLHGAGLIHMLWMPKDSKVVELRKENDMTNNCFYALANALDLEYYYFLVNAVKDGPTQDVDFFINVESFEKFLFFLLN